MSQAEIYDVLLKSKKITMTVVSQRTELIAYYERRAYHRTGIIKKFPVHRSVGVPFDNTLTIEYLDKIL